MAVAFASDTNWADIYSIKSSPYCLHAEFDSTHPDTIGRAISIVLHPPPAHFGCAQRNITELQLPKSATGPLVVVFARGFIYEFHMALLFAPDDGLYAVKLLPNVVATGAAVACIATSPSTTDKNAGMYFIFSLGINFNTKNSFLKDKNRNTAQKAPR